MTNKRCKHAIFAVLAYRKDFHPKMHCIPVFHAQLAFTSTLGHYNVPFVCGMEFHPRSIRTVVQKRKLKLNSSLTLNDTTLGGGVLSLCVRSGCVESNQGVVTRYVFSYPTTKVTTFLLLPLAHKPFYCDMQ